jgi:FdhD protein
MRTPCADHDLTVGFLFAERVIRSATDILSITRGAESHNVMDVHLVDARARELARRTDVRRRVVMNSSCGLCGRVTIETWRVEAPDIVAEWTIPACVIGGLPDTLRRAQAMLRRLEAFTRPAYSIGRAPSRSWLRVSGGHNAMDKVASSRGRDITLEARLVLSNDG